MRRSLILVLALCILAAIIGCEKATNNAEQSDSIVAWQCITEPDVFITIQADIAAETYCGLSTTTETAPVSMETSALYEMLSDGHWKGLTELPPQLGPSPPLWNNLGNRYSDIIEGVWINGSTTVSMRVHGTLPEHSAIHKVDLEPTTE